MSNARSLQEIAGLLLLSHSSMYILLTSVGIQGGLICISRSSHLASHELRGLQSALEIS